MASPNPLPSLRFYSLPDCSPRAACSCYPLSRLLGLQVSGRPGMRRRGRTSDSGTPRESHRLSAKSRALSVPPVPSSSGSVREKSKCGFTPRAHFDVRGLRQFLVPCWVTGACPACAEGQLWPTCSHRLRTRWVTDLLPSFPLTKQTWSRYLLPSVAGRVPMYSGITNICSLSMACRGSLSLGPEMTRGTGGPEEHVLP